MTIQERIEQIKNETAKFGNTNERVSRAFQGLKDYTDDKASLFFSSSELAKFTSLDLDRESNFGAFQNFYRNSNRRWFFSAGIGNGTDDFGLAKVTGTGLGTVDEFILRVNYADKYISIPNRLAVGKQDPERVFDVKGVAGSDAVRVETDGGTAETTLSMGWTGGHHAVTADVYADASNSSFRTRRARGTKSIPTAVLNNDFIGSYTANGYDGIKFPASSTSAIIMRANGDFSETSHPTTIDFLTTKVGETSKRRVGRFNNAGQLQLGGVVNADLLFQKDGSGSHRLLKDGQFLRVLADDDTIVAEFQNSTLGNKMTRLYGRLQFDGFLSKGNTTIVNSDFDLTNMRDGFFSRNLELSGLPTAPDGNKVWKDTDGTLKIG